MTRMHKEYIKRNLEEAIRTMRKACDDAERNMEMYKDQPDQQPATVMHCLTWGLANASSGIESAMNQVARNAERERVEYENQD